MKLEANKEFMENLSLQVEILLCFEVVPDVFVSLKESVFPMASYLDMGNN